MKEAFWGVLIILLGLFGIVVVNLFQNVTIDNDRVYYLIKESTEASAYDALDLTYYRLSGNFRIVEDKFVENLTRRFAQNVTVGNYTIVVEDLNEVPPKVSLRIRSGVTSLKGEEFSLLNRVDGIIETKYSLNEVLSFLCEGKTEEECDEIENNFKTGVEIDRTGTENRCNTLIGDTEMQCISGDIKFIGWDNHNLPTAICRDEAAPTNKERMAIYKTCECGKWSEEKREVVITNPVNQTNEYLYTWVFNKESEVRKISEKITSRIRKEVCTTSIGIQVPANYNNLKPGVTGSSTYVNCPSGGIRVPVDTVVPIRGSYNPANSINRELIWTKNNANITLKYDGNTYAKLNPNMNTCELNSTNTNCYSVNEVTAKTIGSSIVTATNLRRQNQQATCNITVWDGIPDTLGCKNITMGYNDTRTLELTYTPLNASKLDVTWSLSNNSVATINKDTGSIHANNTSTSPINVTVSVVSKYNNSKVGSCTVTISGKPSTPTGYYVGGGECGTYTIENEHVDNTEIAFWDAAIGKFVHKPVYSRVTYSNGHKVYGSCMVNGKRKVRCEGLRTKNIDNPNLIWSYDLGYESCSYKPSCFLAGTKILTKDGLKNIEDIKIGDIVLSYNTDKQINEYNKVQKLFEYYNDGSEELYELTINNKIIKVTASHAFYVNNKLSLNVDIYVPNSENQITSDRYYDFYQPNVTKINDDFSWISAKNLKIGYKVMDSNGNYYSITNIIHYPYPAIVYNFSVENNYNYYVTDSSILVHNKIYKFGF